MTLWATFYAMLGLVHVYVRMTTRDMEIQKWRLQREEDDLINRQSALNTEISRLSGAEGLRAAKENPDFYELTPDQIPVWDVPRSTLQKYERAWTQIAEARSGGRDTIKEKSLLARLLETIVSPVYSENDRAVPKLSDDAQNLGKAKGGRIEGSKTKTGDRSVKSKGERR